MSSVAPTTENRHCWSAVSAASVCLT